MDNIQKPIEWQDEDNSTLDFDYKATQEGHAIIKVVGVGGGGSNAVRHMYQEGIQDVSFLIINTDYQALKGSPIPNKLQISDKGLGAGAKPEVARKYALQYEDQIKAALQDGTEMVFITAGMGGGTGTGAAPIVARIAHDLGILTVGIVTIPFEFEGRDKILMALEGVAAIKEHVDALLVVNNNRLIDIYPDFNFFNAFKKADDTLTIAAKSISDIINIEGYMNLDFADVSTTLRDGGVALISTGQAKGDGRVSAAIKEAITSPLLQDNDISNAKHLLFEICFSESNPVSMSEIAELNDFVKTLSSDIKVIWGAMVDNSLGDDVKLIILASGFEMDHSTGRVYANHAIEKVLTKNDYNDGLDDDNEPAGTAGMPMLDALRKNNMEKICAVTVRYFGGIKLGAGGLIRAYGSAVSEALKIAKLVEDVEYSKFELTLPYDLANKVNHLIEKEGININKEYDEEVKYTYLSNDEIDEIMTELGANENMEIKSGITPDMQIITTWSSDYHDGLKVVIAENN